MKKIENRRKLSNLNIDTKAQLRFAKPFLVLLLSALLVITLIFRQIVAAEDLNRIILTASAGMIVLGLFALVFWITYSHRVFGPVVALRRHVTALREGNYNHRIVLRKNDELKDLAEDLNKLAESLQSARV